MRRFCSLRLLLLLALSLPALHCAQSTDSDDSSSSSADSTHGSSASLLPAGVHYFPCVPPSSSSACGRAWFPGFLDAATSSSLLSLASFAFSLTPGGSGPVTVFDVVSGALSYHERFVSAFALLARQSLELPTPALAAYWAATQRVKAEVRRTFNVTGPLYLTRPSFIAQIDGAKPPVTAHDEYFHPHVDLEQYGTFAFTALLYLSTWGEDFEGGEFVFKDAPHAVESGAREVEVDAEGRPAEVSRRGAGGEEAEAMEWEVRPSQGGALYFSSASENLHYVRRVQSGRRTTLTIAFTREEEPSIEAELQAKYGDRIAHWQRQQAERQEAVE